MFLSDVLYQDLLSFPTRRSSDLSSSGSSSVAATSMGHGRIASPIPTRFRSRLRGRSEEHTSELQSRPHLVCRLLLEKKKKRTQTCRSKLPQPPRLVPRPLTNS